jgi:cysteine-rich repeat protein
VVVACLPGFYDLDPIQPGCEYPCTLGNGGMKTCGSLADNDCNGVVDASEFDLQTDPVNCGDCGHNCEAARPFGTQVSSPACVTGECQFECMPNYYDRNGDLPTLGESSNGCEDYCEVTNPTELCDGLDNDCNGLVDEGFDLQTDPANCGTCGRSCETIKGDNTVVTGCVAGGCQFACSGPGFVDRNGDLALGNAGDGCECSVGVEVCDGADNDCNGVADDEGAGGCVLYYRDRDLDTFGESGDSRCLCAPDPVARYTALAGGDCNDLNAAVRPDAMEVCDGVDNDCDGQTDRDSLGVLLTRACYTGPAGTEGVGPCQGGTQTCTGGIWSATCEGEVTPQLEVCDGVDNNCAGGVDEGFDLTSDTLHCGACNYRCSDNVPNAVSTCQASACVVVACLPGFYDLDPMQPGCEYPCTLQMGGVKTCGSLDDNDCNGVVDASEFDVQIDPANCGSCGHNCEVTKPGGTEVVSPDGCVAGVCQFACLAGYRDVDGDLPVQGEASNGCECAITNGGVEACDSIDNDCDGDVDEDFNLQGNPEHCGACNNACSDLGAPAPVNAQLLGCVTGRCTFGCLAGWNDLDGDLNSGVAFGPGNNGCEYPCTPSGPEVCDGADNDCNGLTDEGSDGLPLRRSCYTGASGTEGNLPCRTGIETCNPATGDYDSGCLGEVTPVPEICGDGVDNDCDGTADDGFDFNSDTNHCGGCNNSCVSSLNMPANALPDTPPCQSGQCRYVCIAGFADLNGDLNSGNPPGPGNNGCEHTCQRYPPAPEECNGIDDDCDNEVDEELPATQDICFQGAVSSLCHGVTATCRDPDGPGGLAKGWWCNYPAGVELDPGNPNGVFPVETLCDGLDGDCDGVFDDDFGVGDVCTNGGIGACRVAATVVCDGTTTSKCDLPDPGLWPVATNELCDGVDNDCDGLVDESQVSNVPANDQPGSHEKWVVDPVVTVTRSDGFTSQVYLYEASRPSATDSSAGVGTAVRACSRPDVLPWSFVTYRQAARACARAGMRLCRPAEWTEACDGQGVDWVYPYGELNSDFDAQECNGAENAVGAGAVLTTSELALCTSEGYGIYDLSGNLREWTNDFVAYSSTGKSIYRLRGGSYRDYFSGLQCDFSNSSAVEDVPAEHVGFRCCTSCGNGNIESWEQCDGQIGCHPLLCVWETCGNGIQEGTEQCDDGNNIPFDGCAADCTREQTCGDGLVEGGEECDDAAFLAMGVCDPNCQWNFITERESNNGCAASVSANNRAAAPVLFAGAWLSGDYSDYYAVDIPAGTHTLRVQTFDRYGPYTCAGINTRTYVYNASCTQVFYSDANNGPGNCENGTVANVTGPVTYYVRVRENGDDNTGYYSVLITLE